ncbi:MAG TPA: amino acid racemase [Geminicoccaceae bacterium]|jgi:aspartate racemase|nr:amino acid racemase [Geminicoccaceae bacterium]
MIGVLGGMGPAATVDFMTKLVRLTPAERDQDHVPVVVVSDPRIPDRVAPIMGGCGRSPLPALRAGIRTLEQAGAACIAIPCHTAHFWYDEMLEASNVPILHIADAVLSDLARQGGTNGPIGLLATAATLKAGCYQERLGAAGYACTEPAPEIMATCVRPAIALVKRNRAADAAPLLARALSHLIKRGAQRVLLACTELPLVTPAAAHDPAVCLDATEALARACIAWHREHGGETGNLVASARN